VELYVGGMLVLFFVIEWFGRTGHYALEKLVLSWPMMVRRGFYLMIAMFIFLFGAKQADFIYFQF
jgi:hypothetical protein